MANNCDSFLEANSARELGLLEIVEPSKRFCANVTGDHFDYSVHLNDLMVRR